MGLRTDGTTPRKQIHSPEKIREDILAAKAERKEMESDGKFTFEEKMKLAEKYKDLWNRSGNLCSEVYDVAIQKYEEGIWQKTDEATSVNNIDDKLMEMPYEELLEYAYEQLLLSGTSTIVKNIREFECSLLMNDYHLINKGRENKPKSWIYGDVFQSLRDDIRIALFNSKGKDRVDVQRAKKAFLAVNTLQAKMNIENSDIMEADGCGDWSKAYCNLFESKAGEFFIKNREAGMSFRTAYDKAIEMNRELEQQLTQNSQQTPELFTASSKTTLSAIQTVKTPIDEPKAETPALEIKQIYPYKETEIASKPITKFSKMLEISALNSLTKKNSYSNINDEIKPAKTENIFKATPEVTITTKVKVESKSQPQTTMTVDNKQPAQQGYKTIANVQNESKEKVAELLSSIGNSLLLGSQAGLITKEEYQKFVYKCKENSLSNEDIQKAIQTANAKLDSCPDFAKAALKITIKNAEELLSIVEKESTQTIGKNNVPEAIYKQSSSATIEKTMLSINPEMGVKTINDIPWYKKSSADTLLLNIRDNLKFGSCTWLDGNKRIITEEQFEEFDKKRKDGTLSNMDVRGAIMMMEQVLIDYPNGLGEAVVKETIAYAKKLLNVLEEKYEL